MQPGKSTSFLTRVRLAEDSARERYLVDVLPWVHEAGNPYFDWMFGGREAARQTLASWMRRPSSEVSLARMTLLLSGDEAVGGFIGLGGAELAQSRKADWLAMLKESSEPGRSELMARLGAVRGLFPRVEPEEFYLSKMGVMPELRGTGLGRRVAEEFLAAGRAAGFRRFRLDVWSENTPARRLYESLGFRVVSESASAEAGMCYLAMVREEQN